MRGIVRAFILWGGIAFGAALVLYGLAGASSAFEKHERSSAVQLRVSAKRWARNNLADRDAEIVGIGSMRKYNGQSYAVVRIRGKNAFGGPVINDFVAEISGDSVVSMWKPKEFLVMQSLKLGKLKGEAQAKRESDLAELVRHLGFTSLLDG
jgi:hypothetical protein